MGSGEGANRLSGQVGASGRHARASYKVGLIRKQMVRDAVQYGRRLVIWFGERHCVLHRRTCMLEVRV